MYKIFSFSSLDVKVVVNISQSRKISTLFTLKIYRTYCSVKKREENRLYHVFELTTCILHINVFNRALSVLEDAIAMDGEPKEKLSLLIYVKWIELGVCCTSNE